MARINHVGLPIQFSNTISCVNDDDINERIVASISKRAGYLYIFENDQLVERWFRLISQCLLLFEGEEDDFSHPISLIDLEGTCISPATDYKSKSRFVIIHPMRKPIYLATNSIKTRDDWLIAIKNHCCGPGGEVVSAFDSQDEEEFRKAEDAVQKMISVQLNQLKQQLKVNRNHCAKLTARQQVLATEVANLEQRAQELEAETPSLVALRQRKSEILTEFEKESLAVINDRKCFVQVASSFFRRMQIMSEQETLENKEELLAHGGYDALLQTQEEIREQVESGKFAMAHPDDILTDNLDDAYLYSLSQASASNDPNGNFFGLHCTELCALVKELLLRHVDARETTIRLTQHLDKLTKDKLAQFEQEFDNRVPTS